MPQVPMKTSPNAEKSFNWKQVVECEMRMRELWNANWILIDALKDIQGSLSLDDPQQRSIFNRIDMTLGQI